MQRREERLLWGCRATEGDAEETVGQKAGRKGGRKWGDAGGDGSTAALKPRCGAFVSLQMGPEVEGSGMAWGSGLGSGSGDLVGSEEDLIRVSGVRDCLHAGPGGRVTCRAGTRLTTWGHHGVMG